MQQQTYTVGDKTYSREQLIAFGKEHYPKFYWIPRILGIIFMFSALFIMMLIGIVMLILHFTGVLSEPDFPIWAFFIPLGVFGLFFIAGLITFIVSFVGRTEEKYISHALEYITKVELKQGKGSIKETDIILSERDREALARYDRLLKGGVISQEEYEEKRKEILGC